MSMDNIDLEALDRDLQEFARQQHARGWWRRNWRWFVPTLLVALILLGGGAIYWSFFTRVYHLDVYQTAMQKIEADEGLRRELGQPIQTVGWPPPSARVEASEKDVRWDIEGPKGRAKAHVNARLMQGQWEIIVMEVVLAGGKKVLLTEAGSDASEAPPFTGAKAETKKSEVNAPAPEINLPTPPDDGPGKS